MEINTKKEYEMKNTHYTFFVLFLLLVFLFTNNHPALFVADYYVLLVLFILFGIFTICSRGTLKIDYFGLTILFLLLSIIIKSCFNYKNIDRGTLLSYILWFLVLFVASNLNPTKKDVKIIFNGFIIGSLIISLMIFIFQEKYGFTQRYTIKFFNNATIDPNYLGCFLYLGFSFGLFYLIKRKERGIAKNIVLVAAIFLIITAIFLTGSRAAYVCVALVFVGYFIEEIKKLTLRQKLSMLIIFIILGIIAIAIMKQILPENILNRFGFDSLNDGSNKMRLDHWKHGIEAFVLNPIGYGAMHTKDILSQYVGHKSDAHNTYLTLLLHFGIFDFCLIMFIFLKTIKFVFKYRNWFWFLFVAAFLVNGLIIANHLGVPFWMTTIILYYLNKNNRDLEYFKRF